MAAAAANYNKSITAQKKEENRKSFIEKKSCEKKLFRFKKHSRYITKQRKSLSWTTSLAQAPAIHNKSVTVVTAQKKEEKTSLKKKIVKKSCLTLMLYYQIISTGRTELERQMKRNQFRQILMMVA